MDAHRDEPATKKDLDQVKQELTDKIDANSAKIDRIALQVIENREQMATKDAVNERFDAVNERLDELLRGQDEMIGIFTRLDEERVATTAWIRRVEGDVETNKSEIKKIKTAKELRDRGIGMFNHSITHSLNHLILLPPLRVSPFSSPLLSLQNRSFHRRGRGARRE